MLIAKMGEMLPDLKTSIPGPKSKALADTLCVYECPKITQISAHGPILWREAIGANVVDVDENRYIDLTAGFGVANAGHRAEGIVSAINAQASLLLHALGDVYPGDVKFLLLKKLAEVTPGDLKQTILCSSGAEAVEAALKTAYLYTGKPGVIAFEGSYHGLTQGALEVTGQRYFRDPFLKKLSQTGVFVPYPDPFRPPFQSSEQTCVDAVLEHIDALLKHPGEKMPSIGAIIVEPIQGRGGIIVPPDDFLPRLRELCTQRNVLLIVDEIYTGFGRTGKWFATSWSGIVPDLMCIGKGLSGGFPISACIGTKDVMSAWDRATGEALYTSTFLGHPLGCAMALASIEALTPLIDRSAMMGASLKNTLEKLKIDFSVVGDVRGKGLMIGVDFIQDASKQPNGALARIVTMELLKRGIIALYESPSGHVLSLTPPLSITEHQIDFCVEMLTQVIAQQTDVLS